MKTRRRHIPFGENVDPSAFDYTLLGHLNIHDDGNDVIDFGGFSSNLESTQEVQLLLKNRSFTEPVSATKHRTSEASVPSAALLHLQGDDPATIAVHEDTMPLIRPRREISRLVSIESADMHIWLVTQTNADRPPFARMFASPDTLMHYIQKHGMNIPAQRQKPKLDRETHPTDANVPFPMPQNRREQGPLPTTKWIDVQADPNDPNSNAMLRQLLSHFPLDEATVGNCLYLTPQDYVDTTHLSSRTASYAFFTITCTPLQGIDYTAGRKGPAARHRRRHHHHHTSSSNGTEDLSKRPVPSAREAAGKNSNARKTKGVMEMRFEAVGLELPRTSVPDAVAVAVVAFADWVITIHEKPFAEMDDLLRVIQLHCSPRPAQASFAGEQRGDHDAPSSHFGIQATPPQRFTSAFVFVNLLQISIGHYLDSVALAQAVDELGDVVFDIKHSEKEQDKVLQRITAVRRCFGECGADVTRRESIVNTLLLPNLAHNFLLRDAGTRERLLNAQAHMRYVQHELSDCRDTVAVANWHHNVALQWILLRRGNKALRQLLQLTEMANIMYPVITIQTLYSMNVPVPFDAEGDPPNESLVPFFVLAAVIVIYALLCSRAIYRMFKRTPFKTRLLA